MAAVALGSRPASVPASSRAACRVRRISAYPAAMPPLSLPGRPSVTYNVRASYVPCGAVRGSTPRRRRPPWRPRDQPGHPESASVAARAGVRAARAALSGRPGPGPPAGTWRARPGVSQATVSLVLGDKWRGRVSERTAGLVREAAARARLPAQPRRPQPAARPHQDGAPRGARADQRVLRPGLRGRRPGRRRARLRRGALPLPRRHRPGPGPLRLRAHRARRGHRLLDGRRTRSPRSAAATCPW